ncbi:4'-phosphopantetheinyl transferase family protein [Mucilaginibacter gotjawali]|uniref:4'-phosphopantetheinyl transferase n=2 Tax=Mucilaginibacter gotjawali TaxID=1550579 RepID=A0A839SH86_9SPHI|nr:4'-phosphopantetheinyl transferase superfamily protein [Mucilaginibacter gotjawali]MBB3056260.1 4'-phosphopantetheinyl transferase [Mucilaginibacter gotjawali]BAU54964.1 4'-phosphopantetheinyl transferase psf-1 [Mucilaginibacter gotjawali]
MVQIKVSNSFLSQVKWDDSSGCAFSINNQADIWRINIHSNSSSIQNLSTLLTRDEQVKAGRFLHKHDSDRYIISRGALKLIMGRYLNRKPALIEIETGENKKPYIKDSPLFYNLSHSGDWIILAVSDALIGIDTELVNNSYDFSDVINEYFSPEESHFINQEKSTERFFMLWTRKEALTKATGKGLDEDLKFIPCLDGQHYLKGNILSSHNNWTVSSFMLHKDYFASAAISDKTGDIRFWETDLGHKNFAFF